MNNPNLYQEIHRPQFHFTPKKDWMNDPNGLVYFDGEYHLYFQHTPGSLLHGPTVWGHAVGTDLIHWEEIHQAALDVDDMGWMWSGSAAVDHHNTGGFQTGEDPPIIAFYTVGGVPKFPDKPCRQCIAYSNDRGRTWTKYEGNPVIEHIRAANRDPKVIWHEPSARWIMTLFLDENDYTMFASKDLKSWTHLHDLTLPGVSECPDFFELPVDGNPEDTRWVFWGASGGYLLGRFDGHTFTSETDVLQAELGANGYAAQTWSDIPTEDGRRIQISWMARGIYPAMPFNQQMSFPVELTLRTLPEGVRLCREPVKEIESLHDNTRIWTDESLIELAAEQHRHRNEQDTSKYPVDVNNQSAGRRFILSETGDLFDVRMEVEVKERTIFSIEVQGHRVTYDAAKQTISCFEKSTPLRSINGRLTLQLLIDRTSLELFGNNGEISMSFCFLPAAANYRLALHADEGETRIHELSVHDIKSIWGMD